MKTGLLKVFWDRSMSKTAIYQHGAVKPHSWPMKIEGPIYALAYFAENV
jgi:hypothetical protein